jgi:hypothetical protein
MRTPIRRIGRCARATSGHDANVPPTRKVKSRRFNRIRYPQASWQHIEWESSNQGLAAVRDFDRAYVSSGSWSCENKI